MSVNTDRIGTSLFKSYQQLSSGRRINSAADDAAGLAISEKMNAQARGVAQGSANAADMKNLLRTAEGGLESIADGLNRLRELSVQALNGTNSETDIAALQKEADQLMEHIKDATKGTQFNTMTLLDGSYKDKQAAVGANGQAIQINLQNSSLEALFGEGFKLEEFKINDPATLGMVDDALDLVNGARATIGASQNRLDYTINANDTSYLNQMQAMSRIADADIGKSVMEKNRAEVLGQYQIFAQKEQMQRTGMMLSLLK